MALLLHISLLLVLDSTHEYAFWSGMDEIARSTIEFHHAVNSKDFYEQYEASTSNLLTNSLFYNFILSFIGLFTGAIVGYWLPDRRLYRRMFTQSEWIQELLEQAEGPHGYITRCFILSTQTRYGRNLMYEGILHRIGLENSGEIAFIVLEYPKNGLFEIGSRHESIKDRFNKIDSEEMDETRFHIGKEEIKNVVFESEPISTKTTWRQWIRQWREWSGQF